MYEYKWLPLKLIHIFLNNRLQRVLLNCHFSAWTPVFARVPHGSIFGPMFFLQYINILAEDILLFTKLFADNTSIFSFVNDINVFADQLNKDLENISA